MEELEKIKKYVVYKHINIINNKIYIGITMQEPEDRWDNGNGYKRCPRFWNAIKKYGWHNFKHVVLFNHLTKQEAEEIEVELIAFYKSNQKKFGYNIANGGNSTGTVSEETKRKMSETRIKLGIAKGKNNPMYGKSGCLSPKFGKPVPQEVRDKISKANKGRKLSEEHKIKVGQANKGRKMSQITKDKISKNSTTKRKVICLNNSIIYDSIAEAGKELNIDTRHISCVCRGKRKSTYGYRFCYFENYTTESK